MDGLADDGYRSEVGGHRAQHRAGDCVYDMFVSNTGVMNKRTICTARQGVWRPPCDLERPHK